MQMKIFKRIHARNGMKTKGKWRKWPLFLKSFFFVHVTTVMIIQADHHECSATCVRMHLTVRVIYFSHKLHRKCFSTCASARGKRENTGTGEGRPAVKIACFYRTETEMTFSRWHQKLCASVYFKLGPPSVRQEHAGAQRGTDKGDKGMQGR